MVVEDVIPFFLDELLRRRLSDVMEQRHPPDKRVPRVDLVGRVDRVLSNVVRVELVLRHLEAPVEFGHDRA